MIIAAIQALLAENAGVIALVSDRISPQPMPEAQLLPAITVLRVSDVPLPRDSRGQVGLNDARIQVDAWGKTLFEAQSAADAAEAVLDPSSRNRARRPGGIPLYVGLGARVDWARALNRQDIDESDVQDTTDPSNRLHRVSTDYRVRYARES